LDLRLRPELSRKGIPGSIHRRHRRLPSRRHHRQIHRGRRARPRRPWSPCGCIIIGTIITASGYIIAATAPAIIDSSLSLLDAHARPPEFTCPARSKRRLVGSARQSTLKVYDTLRVAPYYHGRSTKNFRYAVAICLNRSAYERKKPPSTEAIDRRPIGHRRRTRETVLLVTGYELERILQLVQGVGSLNESR